MHKAAKTDLDRRAYPRIDTKIKAVVLLHDAMKWGCIIGNYCPGGLYLDHGELDNGYDKDLVPRGERLRVCFNTSGDSGEQSFEVEVKVAHAFDHGIGVAFLKSAPVIVRALEENPGPAPGQPADPVLSEHAAANDSSLMSELSSSIELFFVEEFQEFGTLLEKALLDAAEKAESNEAQGDYILASAHIHEALNTVQDNFVEKSIASLNRLFHQRSQAPEQESGDISAELTLIENDLFEEWIWISSMISSTESKLAWDLHTLQQRLSYAVSYPVDQENNPVGPHLLSWDFKKALDGIDIGLSARKVIYQCLGKRMMDTLGNLYSNLNSVLTRHGIMDVTPQAVRQPHVVGRDTAGNEPLEPPPDSETVADDSPPAPKYEAFRGLFSSTQSAAASLSNGGGFENKESFEYGPKQVLEALQEVPADSHGPLSERLLQSLNSEFSGLNGKGELRGEVEQMIGVTDQLIETFEHDAMLAPALRSPLASIQSSLLQTVLETPEFLTDESHPARKVLNDLGKLSTFLSGTDAINARSSELSRAVNDIIQKLGEVPLDGKESLDATHQELSTLVEKEKQQFESNAKRALEACKGESRLGKAKFAVAKLLKEKTASGDAPMALANLLTLGWPALLTLYWIKGGVESSAWHKYTSVLDRLLEWLNTSRNGPPEARSDSVHLLKDIKAGLVESNCNPMKVNLLIKTLAKGLLGSNVRFKRLKSKRIIISSASIDKIVGIEERKKAVPAEQNRLGKWLPTIRHLKQGQWIVESRNLNQKRPLKLIWREDDGSRFVFVNGTGIKVLDCDSEELIEGFRSQKYTMMRDGELPLVDRSIQHILRTAFEKSSAEITTDHITGLFNRRAFEQRLQHALESALDEGRQHILFTINLDQFELVKHAFGYEASNHLLKKVGSILDMYRSDNTTLARLGDSAFGILVQNCTENSGQKIAENQRTAIDNYMFSWGEHSLSLSASIGMVVVDEKAEDIYTLFRDADTACFLAKESGKDDIRIYKPGDRELDRQRLLAYSASAIDESIEHERLTLFIQPIVPIRPESGLRSHYEVLLRIVGDDGNLITPVDIIEAAEVYDRMQILDRWVISTLFRWLTDHPVEAQDLGGFSINLSGQSIGDSEMLEFILEQLKNTSFPLERIAFEITETATISQSEKAKEFIKAIQKEGCEFYLDDFGTGLSSFEYMKNYAVDCIKIDGCFIQHILESRTDQAMVRSITDIGHFMNKRVIAEFVENSEILQLLGEMGVDYAQGWGVGKPFPISDLIEQ
jgi:diguanylate cyclase (GGDEF)-like protein